MKTKSIFYLCLIIAVIFFALGGFAYGWALAVGIGIGIYIGKILFWTVLLGLGAIVLYFMLRKNKTNGKENK